MFDSTPLGTFTVKQYEPVTYDGNEDIALLTRSHNHPSMSLISPRPVRDRPKLIAWVGETRFLRISPIVYGWFE